MIVHAHAAVEREPRKAVELDRPEMPEQLQ